MKRRLLPKIAVASGVAVLAATVTAPVARGETDLVILSKPQIIFQLATDPSFTKRVLNEYMEMEAAGLIVGGKTTSGDGAGVPVVVYAAAAQAAGFSAEAVLIAQALALDTNSIIASLSPGEPGITARMPALSRLSVGFRSAAADLSSSDLSSAGPLGRLRCGCQPHRGRFATTRIPRVKLKLGAFTVRPALSAAGGLGRRPIGQSHAASQLSEITLSRILVRS